MTTYAPLVDALAHYRQYHRDRRNVATHAAGIPMIVLAVEILLSRRVWELPGFTLTPAVIATVAAALYYLKLDKLLGGALALVLVGMARFGLEVAQMETAVWLGSGIGLFVLGWAFQFLGHHFEGRKPAFLDDLRSLLIGPLFVTAEAAFALGLCGELKREIEGIG
ncbi:MAG: hypothetical protein B7Y88_05330 [Sphingomonadales bacterium 32-64-17]|nr:MAG: hypothetical protein B7Y88_05330 [Sphingomonadales bacterium 32-64-17]